MAIREPKFTLGLEEEYLLVNSETLLPVPAPDGLMEDCRKEMEDQVSPEFLQCQIEVGTKVCAGVAEARDDLASLRERVSVVAAGYGLSPVAVSTHPMAKWHEQVFTQRERYIDLERDLAGVVRRMLICGMHVHVGIEDDDLRIDLMNQFSYFMPHLLALSTSSPFWEGSEMGLKSYRLTVFDNLPRTGMPPVFKSFGEYARAVQLLIENKLIEDASKIWWDLRPSARFPTVESRICDVSPRLDDAIAIAAMTQSIFRMLFVLRTKNQRWRQYDRFLLGENRWRAQRYGVSGGLIDFGRGELMPYPELLEELIDLVMPEAVVLGCAKELASAREIVERGTGADRQLEVYHKAIEDGADNEEALKEVVRLLISDFLAGV
jgi:carboxylate-amine ligase